MTTERMRIAVVIPNTPARGWFDALARDLAARHLVTCFIGPSEPIPISVRAIMAVEAAVRRVELAVTSAVMPAEPLRREDQLLGFERVVDLTSRSLPSSRYFIGPSYDGQRGLAALIYRLLGGEVPLIEVRDGRGDVLAASLAALETPLELERTLTSMRARTLALLDAALERRAHGGLMAPLEREPAPRSTARALRFGADRLGAAISARTSRPQSPGSWTVAIRRSGEGEAPPAEPGTDWQVDDTGRFWADPCLHARKEEVTLFAETLDRGSSKGRIVAARVDQDGRLGPPRTVLEAEHHLSYPFVFNHDGETFMIPESGAARRVDLLRCTGYPDCWSRETTLISGPKLVDATPLFNNGLWWLFCGGAEHGDSAHDQLFIYHANALTGPWRPHVVRPVISDARRARPAGAVQQVDGRLYRPSQDNQRRYGGGLVWSEILELTPDVYSEREVARWAGPDFGAFNGVHTFSRAGGFEAIDLLKL